MTALTLRASQALLASPLAVFGRLFSQIAVYLDVFAEAQKQAIAAHRQYPFGDW
ncbi:MAG: hypothetical protein ACTHLO_00360 [Pseudolabrys sp.]